tara:strand:+ start:6328 stop:7038 length:711 start_codon:yes stop_codon:yes gene_type:complete
MALPELNTARYEMVIPSTGQTVSFRPYLVKEEKILMMAMESDDNKVIMKATMDVIKSCIYDDFDVEELAMFDIETIFLELRSKSVGEKIDLKIKCEDEKCDVINDVVLNFDDIERPVVNDDINKIMITDDVGVIMKYPSMKYIDEMTAVGDNDTDQAMNMIMSSIDAIFDKDEVYPAENETKENLQKFVDSLSTVQFMKLSDFFRDMPGLKHVVNFKCECGKEQEQTLRGLSSFFT